jgi:hypothetical protein
MSSCLVYALQETAKSTRAKTLVDKDQALVDSLSRGFVLIYEGFGPRRQNIVDYVNLRRDPRRLSNLRRWTWAVVG